MHNQSDPPLVGVHLRNGPVVDPWEGAGDGGYGGVGASIVSGIVYPYAVNVSGPRHRVSYREPLPCSHHNPTVNGWIGVYQCHRGRVGVRYNPVVTRALVNIVSVPFTVVGCHPHPDPVGGNIGYCPVVLKGVSKIPQGVPIATAIQGVLNMHAQDDLLRIFRCPPFYGIRAAPHKGHSPIRLDQSYGGGDHFEGGGKILREDSCAVRGEGLHPHLGIGGFVIGGGPPYPPPVGVVEVKVPGKVLP